MAGLEISIFHKHFFSMSISQKGLKSYLCVVHYYYGGNSVSDC